MKKSSFGSQIRQFVQFSKREYGRVLLLIPMLVALGLLFNWGGKPRYDRNLTMYSDHIIDSTLTPKPYNHQTKSAASSRGKSSDNSNVAEKSVSKDRNDDSSNKKLPLFEFDPNTLSINEFMQLGFSHKQAQTIINYRNAGAVFIKPEDFKRCYSVSEDKFAELLPYIRIHTVNTTKSSEKADSNPSERVNVQSEKSESDLNTTNNRRNQQDNNQIRNYSSGDNRQESERSKRTNKIELNYADSTDLVSVTGIGTLTAQRILDYRERLGGFVDVTQLQEVAGMNDKNYQQIIQQICVDSSRIQKIDINFASAQRIMDHPYIPARKVAKLLKNRQLKGGWRSIGDLEYENILTSQEAEKLSPYLLFRTD